MKGVDYLETLPYVDRERIGAAGASFGGYMMNWFAIKTGRFKCLIRHCGIWNFDSRYATTEELWGSRGGLFAAWVSGRVEQPHHASTGTLLFAVPAGSPSSVFPAKYLYTGVAGI